MANSLRIRFSNHGSIDKEQEMADSSPRKTTRVRKQPKKYGDFMPTTPTKRNTYKDPSSSDDLDEDIMYAEASRIKPTGLFSNDEVEGQDMFQFKSRHTALDLQKVVESAISNSPKTPRKLVLSQAMQDLKVTENTPRHARKNIEKHKDQEIADSSPRKTTRVRKQPKKYGDFMPTTPTKRNVYKEPSSSDDLDEDMMDAEVSRIKPTALFSNDEVEGQDMFQFKSRHTALDLQKAVESAISNSPKPTPKTPRKSLLSQAMQDLKVTENTPRHVRKIIKKRIIREVESESGDSDFSGGSSDEFKPGESENETESQTSDSDASENEEELQHTRQKTQIVKTKSKYKPKDPEYFFKPDNYFMMHSSKKIQTSDHTLARLKNLNLDENGNQEIQISKEHKEKIMELNATYKHLFNRWLYVLSENFNIILYGIGSKQSVLKQFQMEKLEDFPCIVVNGYFPSVTIKSILESIIINLLGNSHMPTNIGDTMNLIDTQLSENEAELFLIIHNIDGAMLRSAKAQATLASLSQIRNVHMIATIDHISAPLLWDSSKLSKFKFTWWDVTTFQPYLEETSFENSVMSNQSGALQLSSLKSVYQSLTTNAKGIFNVIIEHQLENQKQAHYQGLPFKDLYSKSREQFLVSSDHALRAQLTEFLDHKLVKMKRTYDGCESLIIPIDTTLLQQFLEEQKT